MKLLSFTKVSVLLAILALWVAVPSQAAAPRGASAVAASACSTSGAVIYNRVGISCTKAKRVLSRYLAGLNPGSGWSCTRRQCSGSGLSIDEYRMFSFR